MHDKLLNASLRQFQILYLGSLLFLFSILVFLAYTIEIERLTSNETGKMNAYVSQLEQELKEHHFNASQELLIDTKGYDIGLYDVDHAAVITSIKKVPRWDTMTWTEDGVLSVRYDLSVYFLGVSSIFVAKKIESYPIVIHLAQIFIPLFVFMVLMGIFLSRTALRPAKKAFETVDTFIKHATHDLNTPIAAILANSRLLEEKIEDETLKRIVQRTIIGAKTLSGLYEDLLYLSFERRIWDVRPEPIDALIQERLALFETLAAYKRISITTHLSPVTLKVSAEEWKRLFDNLYSNAIKYTQQEGSITITLSEEMLSVKDDGIGLSKEEQMKIFERYWRAESFETGLGIGMEIIVRISKTYNLLLTIHSEKNQGSEFVITWPKSLVY